MANWGIFGGGGLDFFFFEAEMSWWGVGDQQSTHGGVSW